MRYNRRRRSYTWQEALIASLDSTFTPFYVRLDAAGGFTTSSPLAIYGDTVDDVAVISAMGASPAGVQVADALERRKHLTRIVGDITYRGYGFPGVSPGSNGANPQYIVRVGCIVLPSDGSLGVPVVGLDIDSSDIESSWLYREQFTVVGADQFGSNTSELSPSTDGLNHLYVDRHYDIRVNRAFGRNDVLVWNMFVGVVGNNSAMASPAEAWTAVAWWPHLRLLAT